ncbi:MAG: helix-turn-helix domain-containing protein [Clostridia bacterium]|nr:helix-turn-helix domain-containing protein [Clostridia bacterium]
MNAEILSFINGITLNTGISLAVARLDGASILGEWESAEIPKGLLSVPKFDLESNKTYFTFTYKSVQYVARLNGTGELEKSYAFLISQLASASKSQEMDKQEFLHALVFNEVDGQNSKKFIKKFALSDKPCFAMLISVDTQRQDDVIEFLNSYGTQGDFVLETDDDKIVLVKTCNEAIDDYVSCTDYAEFLTRSLFEETGIKARIGVGGIVDGLEKINQSFSQSRTALDMMDVLKTGGDVHTYKEYFLIKMLGDMPKNKLSGYLNVLLDGDAKTILDDQELMQTAEAFLDNNLNISETSRKTFLHRNTLSYRLDKIEKATGLNLRKFSDAIGFRLITILSKLTR